MSSVRHVALVIATKAAVGALVLAGGFRAVSDDDFARVVLAQQWALDPRLDPTGTSWLPLPFWIYGAAMRSFGLTLETARATAFVLGLASAALIYAAARLLLERPRDALLGALLAAVFPWSARLGVATVPELPTAALTIFAVGTLANARVAFRLLGGLALVAACLSRYDAWPVAAAFAALCLWDARRERGHALAAALACVGPAAWLVHNAVAHGDALHFAARVAAYSSALGARPLSLLEGYPLALVREEPELAIVGALLVVGAARARSFPAGFARTSGVFLFMLIALALAALPGGAPTHHTGRALLAIWLFAAIYVGAGARAALRAHPRAFAAVVVIALPLGAFVLRPWYAQLDAFSPRRDEVAVGRAVGEHVPAGERVLVDTVDYGYYAIVAASARPHELVLDRSLDPRGRVPRSSFSTAEALARRLEETGAGYVVTPQERVLDGQDPLARAGAWGLWRVP